ncbi:LacI family DNA-binding transcriptional regulator [Membranicola marinus]|uniref:LacI family DNA-binding transcriptional regulator n=1 Tax=Membranihabitans marinus TaxID=1227546 RepID=A0A953HM21_9BACT|nr:LacI family DNA-binding transcriptional regulator [Membranihabitans marinus]MBY5956993.1 LacI family DNA-binding transcriptional regulator [Membranihabitans marinus]
MSKLNDSNKPYGIKEIARKANVSIATVDRVIHKRGGVARKTQELILSIIDEFDYQPNILASRLRSNKTYNLAILIPQVSKYTNFWAAPYQGVEKANAEISQFGINLKTYFFRLSQSESFTEQAELLLADNPDGVVIAPLFIQEATHLSDTLFRNGIPYVYIDTDIPDQNNLSYIGPPIYQSGLVAGQLALFGMRENGGEILVINHTNIINDGQHIKEIERGFVDYIERNKASVKIHSLNLPGADMEMLDTELGQYFEAHPNIQAVFVTNSRVFKVAQVFKNQKIQDKILIGFDNIDENVKALKEEVIDFLICHQPEEQGYRGVMNLYQNILLSQKIDKVQYMPIDIITKENCDFYSN